MGKRLTEKLNRVEKIASAYNLNHQVPETKTWNMTDGRGDPVTVVWRPGTICLDSFSDSMIITHWNWLQRWTGAVDLGLSCDVDYILTKSNRTLSVDPEGSLINIISLADDDQAWGGEPTIWKNIFDYVGKTYHFWDTGFDVLTDADRSLLASGHGEHTRKGALNYRNKAHQSRMIAFLRKYEVLADDGLCWSIAETGTINEWNQDSLFLASLYKRWAKLVSETDEYSTALRVLKQQEAA